MGSGEGVDNSRQRLLLLIVYDEQACPLTNHPGEEMVKKMTALVWSACRDLQRRGSPKERRRLKEHGGMGRWRDADGFHLGCRSSF